MMSFMQRSGGQGLVRTTRSGICAAALLGGLCCIAALPQAGCASAGIAMREKVLGIPKREQLVDRVKDARDAQQEAQKQFNSALEQFIAVTGQEGKLGDLEAKYKKLQREFDRSKDRAQAVKGRIDGVESVGESLFREWKSDIDKMSSASLKSQNEQLMRDTRVKYDDLKATMRTAESKMQPVLTAFQDQVLFLKGNLNAQAIAGLRGEVDRIQGDVSRLIADMQASIDEANAFINQMSGKS